MSSSTKLVLVRIKASGQITEMVPHVATAMINGGTAERVEDAKATSSSADSKPETAALDGAPETTASPKQHPPKKKKRLFSKH